MNTDTAAAPAASSPELIRSDWNEAGACSNPEVLTIGKMPKGTSAKILLGVDPEGRWRFGYEFITGADGGSARAPSLNHPETFENRFDAIHAALLVIGRPFNENAKATKAIEAFYDATKAAAAISAAVPGSIMRKTLEVAQAVKEGKPLPKGRYDTIPVSAVRPNPENHRKVFDAEKLMELRTSLRQVGQLQPIAVRLLSPEELGELPGVGDAAPAQAYEIILGERRWRAHVGEEMPTIEAKIYEGLTRKEAKAAALVENLQRVDVNPVEEAEGYADLIEAEDLTQEECAQRVGRSRPAVANALRLIRQLPADVVDLIRANKLTSAHGLALIKWEKRPLVMKAIAELVISRGTSAGDLEEWNRAGGIPFQRELESAGILLIITNWNKPGGWDRDFPAEILTHADYEKRAGGEQFVCYNPQHWGEVCARENQKIEAEKAEAAAAQKKENAKPKKVKSLEDLPRNSFARMDDAGELASLLPPDTVKTLPDMSEKTAKEAGRKAEEVTVCLAPKFAEKVRAAFDEARKADRAEKMPVILEKARATVRKWKKLGARELATVTHVLMRIDDCEYAVNLAPFALKSQGVKLPSVFAGTGSAWGSAWNRVENHGKAFRTLVEGDSLALLRVLVDFFVVSIFLEDGPRADAEEPAPEDYYWDGVRGFEAGRALLCNILGTDELGLLEESRAGRKQLAEKVKALPWYAEEFAKAKKAGADTEELDREAA